MPGYGWVDLETTAYAIPPAASGNPNNQDVIIPMIDEQPQPVAPQEFKFPWRTAGIAAGILAALALFGLYTFRVTRESYHALRGRRHSRPGLASRMAYTLMKLAREGYPLKAPHQTPQEYAKQVAPIEAMSRTHTELNFRENFAPGEAQQLWQKHEQAYRGGIDQIEKKERRGLWAWLRRVFSLRSLYY